jgi:hypothetical protein
MWHLVYLNTVSRHHVYRHWLKGGQSDRFYCKLHWQRMNSGLLKAISGTVNHIYEIRYERSFDNLVGHFCFCPPWPLKGLLYASPYNSKKLLCDVSELQKTLLENLFLHYWGIRFLAPRWWKVSDRNKEKGANAQKHNHVVWASCFPVPSSILWSYRSTFLMTLHRTHNPPHTPTHTHTHKRIYIFIFIYIAVCNFYIKMSTEFASSGRHVFVDRIFHCKQSLSLLLWFCVTLDIRTIYSKNICDVYLLQTTTIVSEIRKM